MTEQVKFTLPVNKEDIEPFDKLAAAIGLSRNKLAQKLIHWAGHGQIDVSVMIQQDIKQITVKGKE